MRIQGSVSVSTSGRRFSELIQPFRGEQMETYEAGSCDTRNGYAGQVTVGTESPIIRFSDYRNGPFPRCNCLARRATVFPRKSTVVASMRARFGPFSEANPRLSSEKQGFKALNNY